MALSAGFILALSATWIIIRPGTSRSLWSSPTANRGQLELVHISAGTVHDYSLARGIEKFSSKLSPITLSALDLDLPFTPVVTTSNSLALWFRETGARARDQWSGWRVMISDGRGWWYNLQYAGSQFLGKHNVGFCLLAHAVPRDVEVLQARLWERVDGFQTTGTAMEFSFPNPLFTGATPPQPPPLPRDVQSGDLAVRFHRLESGYAWPFRRGEASTPTLQLAQRNQPRCNVLEYTILRSSDPEGEWKPVDLEVWDGAGNDFNLAPPFGTGRVRWRLLPGDPNSSNRGRLVFSPPLWKGRDPFRIRVKFGRTAPHKPNERRTVQLQFPAVPPYTASVETTTILGSTITVSGFHLPEKIESADMGDTGIPWISFQVTLSPPIPDVHMELLSAVDESGRTISSPQEIPLIRKDSQDYGECHVSMITRDEFSTATVVLGFREQVSLELDVIPEVRIPSASQDAPPGDGYPRIRL